MRRVAEIGANAAGIRGDVSDLSDLDRIYEIVRDRKGRLDVLFANAGGGGIAPLGQITEEHFDRTFATNVRGFALHGAEGTAADVRGRLHRPQRVHDIDRRDAGVQRLQRDEGGRAELRPATGRST